MGLAAAAIGIAGLGMQLFGGIRQGQAERSQAAYQAAVAKNNALIAKYNQQIAEQNANYAQQRGEVAATAEGLKEAQQYGALTAGQAASGVDVNSGSAVDVRTSQAAIGRLNTMTIKSDAAREAYGYRIQATNYLNEENAYKAEAKAASASAPTGFDTFLNIAPSLLGSASSIAGNIYSLSNAGAFATGNNVVGTQTLGGGSVAGTSLIIP